MTTYTRADWRARAPRPGPGPLYGTHVRGLAFHWPAMSRPVRGFAAVAAALRAWQDYHMDDRGWSDIAYQVAVDQDGNRWELRGLATQSAANGDQDVNDEFGAVLLILAPGERPTRAMTREARRVVVDHRRLFKQSTDLLGHNEVRPEPTSCPGPIVQGLLDAGAFEPGPSPRDLLRADLNAAMRPVKAGLAKAVRRPRVRFNLEIARRALSRARKRNRGA